MSTSLIVLGRIMLALIFIISGVNKVMGFDGTAQAIASRGLPLPQALAAATIVVELVGGLLIVIGRLVLPAALAIAAFCIVSAAFFHQFWAVEAALFQGEFNNFMKNLAITGGFLVLAGYSIPRREM